MNKTHLVLHPLASHISHNHFLPVFSFASLKRNSDITCSAGYTVSTSHKYKPLSEKISYINKAPPLENKVVDCITTHTWSYAVVSMLTQLIVCTFFITVP